MIPLGWTLVGLAAGLVGFYLLLKYKVEVVKGKNERLVLELPLVGRIRTYFKVKHSGVFTDEWGDVRKKTEKLGRLLDPDMVFHYAEEFGVSYIGFEGDRADKTWSRGRLAYSSLSRGSNGGYNVFLNPSLENEDVARRLSLELGEVIYPSEVQAFLFLHEIGHTRRAGNECYFTAVVNHSIAGGKRSARKRSELILLKKKIESFADQFALAELKKWRKRPHQKMAQ